MARIRTADERNRINFKEYQHVNKTIPKWQASNGMQGRHKAAI